MTENEAIKVLNNRYVDLKSRFVQALVCIQDEENALEMAMYALKELQQYRSIGTAEKCNIYKRIAEKDFSAACLDMKIIDELHEYKSIGTVDECREAVEKQRAKKPIKQKYKLIDDELKQLFDLEFKDVDIPRFPCCNEFIVIENLKYCMECGQKLYWSEGGE